MTQCPNIAAPRFPMLLLAIETKVRCAYRDVRPSQYPSCRRAVVLEVGGRRRAAKSLSVRNS